MCATDSMKNTPESVGQECQLTQRDGMNGESYESETGALPKTGFGPSSFQGVRNSSPALRGQNRVARTPLTARLILESMTMIRAPFDEQVKRWVAFGAALLKRTLESCYPRSPDPRDRRELPSRNPCLVEADYLTP